MVNFRRNNWSILSGNYTQGFNDALAIISRVFKVHGEFFIGDLQQFLYCITGTIILIIIDIRAEFFGLNTVPFKSDYWFKEQMTYTLLIVIILLIGVFDGGQFIYFQF